LAMLSFFKTCSARHPLSFFRPSSFFFLVVFFFAHGNGNGGCPPPREFKTVVPFFHKVRVRGFFPEYVPSYGGSHASFFSPFALHRGVLLPFFFVSFLEASYRSSFLPKPHSEHPNVTPFFSLFFPAGVFSCDYKSLLPHSQRFYFSGLYRL